MKYKYDEELNLWYRLDDENMTYTEIRKPKPTAAMGKYGSMRLNFIWQTPCLLDILLDDYVSHCEEMNEKVLDLIDQIMENKKQSEEYKEMAQSGQFLPRVQMLEQYRAEAEEEILPVTVYAI